MAVPTHNEMQCSEFEALLTDALDGILKGGGLLRFQSHRQSCALCSVMFAEAEAGKTWLHALEEAEPPRNLMHNILAATSGVESARVPAAQSSPWAERIFGRILPVLAPMMQPRFAMSFAMAFFSVSIMLNLAGVRVTDLKYVDLRPAAVRDNTVRSFYETTARVEKYYENLRLVYEIESRVRELTNAATPAEKPQPVKQEKDKKNPNNTSERPEPQKKNDEQYSVQFAEPTWAKLTLPERDITADRSMA